MPQRFVKWLKVRAPPQGLTVRELLGTMISERLPHSQLQDVSLFPFIEPPPGYFGGATGPSAALQLDLDHVIKPNEEDCYAVWEGNPERAQMRPGALEALRAAFMPFVPPPPCFSWTPSAPAASQHAGASEYSRAAASAHGASAKALSRPPLPAEIAWSQAPLTEAQRQTQASVQVGSEPREKPDRSRSQPRQSRPKDRVLVVYRGGVFRAATNAKTGPDFPTGPADLEAVFRSGKAQILDSLSKSHDVDVVLAADLSDHCMTEDELGNVAERILGCHVYSHHVPAGVSQASSFSAMLRMLARRCALRDYTHILFTRYDAELIASVDATWLGAGVVSPFHQCKRHSSTDEINDVIFSVNVRMLKDFHKAVDDLAQSTDPFDHNALHRLVFPGTVHFLINRCIDANTTKEWNPFYRFRGRINKPSPSQSQAQKGRSSEWDLTSVDAPKCATCQEQRWPVFRAKSGKYHCRSCVDSQYAFGVSAPTCAKCGKVTWDGVWRGRKFLLLDQAFVCAACYIIDSGSAPEITKWHSWFERRAAKFPDVFSPPPAIEWCLSLDPR